MKPMSPLVQSLLRHFLQSAASAATAYLVTHQVVDSVDAGTVTSVLVAGGMATATAVAAIATAIWGAWANRKASLVHAVAAMPEVNRVQVNNSEAGVKLSVDAGSSATAPVTVRQSS